MTRPLAFHDFRQYSEGESILRVEKGDGPEKGIITGIYEGNFFGPHSRDLPETIKLTVGPKEVITIKISEIHHIEQVTVADLLRQLRNQHE